MMQLQSMNDLTRRGGCGNGDTDIRVHWRRESCGVFVSWDWDPIVAWRVRAFSYVHVRILEQR